MRVFRRNLGARRYAASALVVPLAILVTLVTLVCAGRAVGQSLHYTPSTGALRLESQEILSAFRIRSSSSQFQSVPMNLDGLFDVFEPHELFKSIDAMNPNGFASTDFGRVLPTELSLSFLEDDLRFDGAFLQGGRLGLIDIHFDANTLVGDFDGSGFLDALDIDLLTTELDRNERATRFDINQDGLVSVDDRDFLVVELLGTQFGDADLDRAVTFADFLILSSQFGASNASWALGDFDGSRRVDFADFLLLSSQFGFSSVSLAAERVVPEPSSSCWHLLLLLALRCLMVCKRSRVQA